VIETENHPFDREGRKKRKICLNWQVQRGEKTSNQETKEGGKKGEAPTNVGTTEVVREGTLMRSKEALNQPWNKNQTKGGWGGLETTHHAGYGPGVWVTKKKRTFSGKPGKRETEGKGGKRFNRSKVLHRKTEPH